MQSHAGKEVHASRRGATEADARHNCQDCELRVEPSTRIGNVLEFYSALQLEKDME